MTRLFRVFCSVEISFKSIGIYPGIDGFSLKTMRKTTIIGTVMVLALTLGVAVPVFGATAADMADAVHGHQKAPLLVKGSTLTITGSGTAYKIGNKTVTESAGLSLTATVSRSSPGRGMLNFTSGSLTIGSSTYTVVRGHGQVNGHNDKMILHLVVKNSAGDTFHLILHGKFQKTSHVESGTGFTVDFAMPQSKLAHLWFLMFPSATVTTS